MKYFRIKNWNKYQYHKKEGSAPWIRLYRSLLNDYNFTSMTESQQLNWIKILLLAAEKIVPGTTTGDPSLDHDSTTNTPPLTHEPLVADPSHIRRCVHARGSVNLDIYIQQGFIEVFDVNTTLRDRPSISTEAKAVSEAKADTRKARVARTPEYSEEFEKIWKEYPEAKGKKTAYGHFRASVKTDADLTNLHTALKNYKAQIQAHRDSGWARPWMNGSTWFNKWDEWVNHKIEVPESKNKYQKARDSTKGWADRLRKGELHGQDGFSGLSREIPESTGEIKKH